MLVQLLADQVVEFLEVEHACDEAQDDEVRCGRERNDEVQSGEHRGDEV